MTIVIEKETSSGTITPGAFTAPLRDPNSGFAGDGVATRRKPCDGAGDSAGARSPENHEKCIAFSLKVRLLATVQAANMSNHPHFVGVRRAVSFDEIRPRAEADRCETS